MTATRLTTKRVEKPWGRHDLWPGFANPAPEAPPVGEIWFQTPDAGTPELLIKYLFPGERLSVQDHPTDAEAQKAGSPRGKDECWVILAAEPGATIAMGTKAPTTREALRQGAEDGSIVDMLDWKPVKAGDFLYCPAGTIHAIGGGITVVETQQNVDLTYRLYDYGRERALSVEAGIAVADTAPFARISTDRQAGPGRRVVACGPAFTVERWRGGRFDLRLDRPGSTFVPVAGTGHIDGRPFCGGQCWLLAGDVTVELDEGADALIAYPAGLVPLVTG